MASIISSCFSWVSAMWNKLPVSAVVEEILRGPPRHLPDEVILQILTKLPAKSILRCRCVCRRWKALISAREFAELHLKHSVPMIIVGPQWGGDGEKQLCLLDTCEATTTEILCTNKITVNSVKPVSKSDRHEFLYSSNGLIIFREEFRKSTSGLEHYVLLNPITREKVRLITPKGLIYGIYFNPFVKDQYCLLWGGRFLRENGSMKYRILVLGGSKSHSQSHPQTCCSRELYDNDDDLFSYQPRAQTPPIIIDDALYWMVGNRYAIARENSSSLPHIRLGPSCAESIVALDTKTEKFSVMPHPGPRDQYCKDDPEHSRMHLVEMDDHGFLCLCESSLFEESINIWILKQQDDRNGPLWMRWHRVNIDLDVSRFPCGTSNKNVRPVVIVDGGLLLEWPSKVLIALNFKMDTVARRIENGSYMYAHSPNFVSLSNCEPEILMST
ncbi:hypothetical protein ACH5RR_001726 [Cinchona calisaya]|uniref:F-box domain-containing protein n=1 Tax=Cinchona calisaya TaxID=153742 RepID=A0ABD3B4A5_9GENT